MTAFVEVLEIVWKENDVQVVTVDSVSQTDFDNGIGAIKSHTQSQYKSKSLTVFQIFQGLYVDDGAFPFVSRANMAQGLELVYHTFSRFGLEMHIGREGISSKRECVFFPPPRFFYHSEDNLPLGEEESKEMESYSNENDYILSEPNATNTKLKKPELKKKI